MQISEQRDDQKALLLSVLSVFMETNCVGGIHYHRSAILVRQKENKVANKLKPKRTF